MTPSWHAANRPDAPAVIMGSSGETTTYAELEDRSSRMARALRSRGIEAGGHIAILMENNRPFLEVAWAAQRSGLHYTAINSHLRPAEVQYVLDDCGAVALVSSEAMAEVIAGLDLSRITIRVSAVGDLEGFERYDEVLAACEPGPLDDEQEGREMLYSSGTTGQPKGVRKPLSGAPFGDPAAVPVQIAQGLAGYSVTSASVYLSPAPLYHAAPLVYSMSMQRLGAAAPCPVPVKRQMLEWWGPIIHEYYAGTEDIGSTAITPEEWLTHPGSVGRPRDECHIVGEDGKELPPGQAGLIYFDNGRPFEYHNDAEKTASVVDERGWRTLGDIGYLDEDGFLYLTDRKSHMIISGGVNIYPQEAENVLAGHPAVVDVAVIGVPDPEMGEAVKAVVQVAATATPGPELEAELLEHCRTELATYKCPRSVDFVDELPRDPNGKLYKRLLKERYWEGHDSFVV